MPSGMLTDVVKHASVLRLQKTYEITQTVSVGYDYGGCREEHALTVWWLQDLLRLRRLL